MKISKSYELKRAIKLLENVGAKVLAGSRNALNHYISILTYDRAKYPKKFSSITNFNEFKSELLKLINEYGEKENKFNITKDDYATYLKSS